LWSIGKLVLYMLQHQWLSVATEILKSMHWKIEGLVTIRNVSFLPLFVPAMRHQILVRQQPLGEGIVTGGIWLKPGGERVLPVETKISTSEVMKACRSAVPELLKEGLVSCSVESTLYFGPFSITRVTTTQSRVTLPFVSAVPRFIQAIIPTRRARKP
jgi:hypothetical protein